MAYVDSSVASPLQRLTKPEMEGDEDEAPVPVRREPEELHPASLKEQLISWSEDANVARRFDDQDLDRLGMEAITQYEIDERSRDKWAAEAKRALQYSMQDAQEKTTPWPGASNVIFPLISKAALDFQARTLPAVIQGRSVVKGTVLGDDRGEPVTEDGKPGGKPVMAPPKDNPAGPPQPQWIVEPGELTKRAERVGQHMSWQLLFQMKEWKPQVDTMLMQIPVIGGALKKTYFDPVESRNRSDFVSLIDVVWDYNASSFVAAPRKSERILRYPHEIRSAELTEPNETGEGMWLALDYGPASTTEGNSEVQDNRYGHDPSDENAPHVFIEQHCRIDLDEDGYAEPYVITVHERSQKVVRIVARYEEAGIRTTSDGEILRIDEIEHYTLVPFLPSIDGGSYPTGFGHLLRHLNEAINAALNQMFDAGTLANTGSGIMGSDVSIPSGDVGFRVGRWIRAKTKAGTNLRDQVMPLPFQGPNQTLFQLLGLLITAGKELASIQEVLTGDANIANAPPTTVLALIEQGMKLNNAIHTRIFWALGEEFQKLFDLNRRFLKDTETYTIGEKLFEVTPEDYRLAGGVEPVADPTMTTDMQRLGRASLIQSIAWGNPLFNQNEVATRILEAGNVDRITDLFAAPDPNAQTMAQLAMAKLQAELGRERAAEQKDMTQAFLNMAMAREHASAEQQAQIDQQLEEMRLQIEQINADTRQRMADVAARKAASEHQRGHRKLDIEEAAAARDAADQAAPDANAPLKADVQPPPPPFPTGGPQSVAPPPAAPAPMPPSDNSKLPPLPPPGADPLAGAPMGDTLAPKPGMGGAQTGGAQ